MNTHALLASSVIRLFLILGATQVFISCQTAAMWFCFIVLYAHIFTEINFAPHTEHR